MKLLKLFVISLVLLISCSKESTEPEINILSAPSNLVVTETGMHTIHLSWMDNSNNETGFIFERSVGDSSNFTIIDTLVENTTTFVDTVLLVGTIYYYRIKAFNPERMSNFSNIVGATTLISTFSFLPDTVSISIGNQSIISLKMDNFEKSIFGISLRINYDSTFVSFSDSTGFNPGDFFDQNAIVFVKEENSVIHLTLTQIQGQSQVFGSGTLGTFTFKGKSAGNCLIQIIRDKLHMYDYSGNEIEISDLKYETATIHIH